ncbi:MAG: MotA/TolQ/ExbB proton channel family protein, partial [Bacilli bacterium]
MKIEIASLVGIILAVVAIGFGIVMKGVLLSALWNPAAILIIIGGTAAAVFLAFPMKKLKLVPVLLKIIFTDRQFYKIEDIILQFIEWSNKSRREGLLALEDISDQHPDTFIRQAMRSVVEGRDPEYVSQLLNEDIYAMEDRHKSNAMIFTQAGTYSPTLGVLGAVVGLIAALG